MANSINATSTGNGGIITTGDDSGVLNIQTNETTALSIDASQNATFTNPANLPNTFGFKNRFINGNMAIDQRNAGASVTVPNTSLTATWSLDRWRMYANVASKYTVQQNAGSVTPPVGFVNYMGLTSSSSYSASSGDYFLFRQIVEGLNVADLAWGTASAATVTLSFWVRSSLTGTFGGSLANSAENRCYVFSYTVNAANTWEQKTITIAGDQSGTWLTSNVTGILVGFDIGSGTSNKGAANSWGSTMYLGVTGGQSIIATSGATLYITGVQLEKGTQATSFDFRSYGTELALCQRYYEQVDVLYMNTAWTTISNQAYWRVTKRTNPTLVNNPASGTGGQYSTFASTAPTGVGLNQIFQTSANSAFAGGWVSGSAEL